MKTISYSERYRNKYYMPKKVRENLYRRGFRYSFLDDGYVLKFPIDTYKNNPTLFARIVINDYTHDIKINVVNNLNNPYPAFYKCENKGYINYLERICRVIDRRMSRMGFKIKRKKKDNIFEYYENPKQIFK